MIPPAVTISRAWYFYFIRLCPTFTVGEAKNLQFMRQEILQHWLYGRVWEKSAPWCNHSYSIENYVSAKLLSDLFNDPIRLHIGHDKTVRKKTKRWAWWSSSREWNEVNIYRSDICICAIHMLLKRKLQLFSVTTLTKQSGWTSTQKSLTKMAIVSKFNDDDDDDDAPRD